MLDDVGRVHPYARPLSFRPPEGRPVDLRAEELGGAVGTEPLPVRMIVESPEACAWPAHPRTVLSGSGEPDPLASQPPQGAVLAPPATRRSERESGSRNPESAVLLGWAG